MDASFGLPLDFPVKQYDIGRHCHDQRQEFKMPTHSETRHLPYSAQQMYDLVADVARYPEFLPWCAAARIRSTRDIPDNGTVMAADLVISFKVFRERFGSRVTLWPDVYKIDTEYLDGPFRYMKSNWAFADAPGGCEVTFFVDFEFKNAVLQGIIGVVFNEAMQRIVRAFERRAAELYG
jgi:coenzyme Q-binding protein COQ10